MDKDELDEQERRRLREKAKIAAMSYNEEREANLKKSYTSFGKLILAEEKTNPIYSIGLADRNAVVGDMITIPKDNPGPKYNPPDVAVYKYHKNNHGNFGRSSRPPLNNKEKFNYFNHVYQAKDDLGNLPKKWQKIMGGALILEPRVKYDFREKVPGPGRYDTNPKPIKPRPPSYYIGEKTQFSSIKTLTGTNNDVGPGKYRPESAKYTSKHRDFPIHKMPKAVRPGLYNKKWAVNETYYVYSSVGQQVMNRKRTEPIINLGKSTRDREKKRGVFNAMMERRPQSVRIQMPKF